MVVGDEPPNAARVVPQRVAQAHDLLHEAGGLRERHHDRPMAALESLRQRDFCVARQELPPAHIREIQPHDVTGRVEPARCEVGLVRVLVRARVRAPVTRKRRRVHSDAGVPTSAEQVVQHRRGGDVDRQHRVDLLAEEVSVLHSGGDELADSFVRLARRHRAGPVCSCRHRARLCYHCRGVDRGACRAGPWAEGGAAR